MKSNIHSKMSRLLELLRSRELWLLGQVDVVHQLEQDLLRGQIGILSKEAARLNACMDLLEKGKASSDVLMGALKRFVLFSSVVFNFHGIIILRCFAICTLVDAPLINENNS